MDGTSSTSRDLKRALMLKMNEKTIAEYVKVMKTVAAEAMIIETSLQNIRGSFISRVFNKARFERLRQVKSVTKVPGSDTISGRREKQPRGTGREYRWNALTLKLILRPYLAVRHNFFSKILSSSLICCSISASHASPLLAPGAYDFGLDLAPPRRD